jgi:hypothetical protein
MKLLVSTTDTKFVRTVAMLFISTSERMRCVQATFNITHMRASICDVCTQRSLVYCSHLSLSTGAGGNQRDTSYERELCWRCCNSASVAIWRHAAVPADRGRVAAMHRQEAWGEAKEAAVRGDRPCSSAGDRASAQLPRRGRGADACVPLQGAPGLWRVWGRGGEAACRF